MSLSLPGVNPGDVHDRNDAADDDRELGKAALCEIVAGKRLIGGAEIHGARLNLRNAAARTDRLIVDCRCRPGF